MKSLLKRRPGSPDGAMDAIALTIKRGHVVTRYLPSDGDGQAKIDADETRTETPASRSKDREKQEVMARRMYVIVE